MEPKGKSAERKSLSLAEWPAVRRVRRVCAGWTRKPKSSWWSAGPYVSYANCGLPYHVGGVIEKESSLLVANEQLFRDHVRDRCADELRGDRDLTEEEDRGPAQCQDRRGHDRVLRQARAVAGRALGPSAAAGHRSAGDFPCADRAGREDDPRVDREEAPRSSRGCSTTRGSSWSSR